jgi:hypothetical protein
MAVPNGPLLLIPLGPKVTEFDAAAEETLRKSNVDKSTKIDRNRSVAAGNFDETVFSVQISRRPAPKCCSATTTMVGQSGSHDLKQVT